MSLCSMNMDMKKNDEVAIAGEWRGKIQTVRYLGGSGRRKNDETKFTDFLFDPEFLLLKY
jgi:hypothetical protein